MLGQRIKLARIAKGLTQKQLAKMLNTTDATVNRYEKGVRKPDPETLKKIANILDVSVDYLLEKIDTPKNFPPSEYENKATKRDLKQYEEFINQAGIFFMNDEVAEEDKEKLFKDISELFWKAKEINKEKYGRKKK